MEHHGIEALGRELTGSGEGPLALVLAEDDVELDGTLRHHLDLGFACVLAVVPDDLPRPALTDPRIRLLRAETRGGSAVTNIVNAAIAAAAPGRWMFYGSNAEYLFFPFCEDRGVAELCTFAMEERRDALGGVTVDLFAADLDAHPGGVSPEAAHLDRIGYFAHGRRDAHGHELDRQWDIFGGLRLRFEEHVPDDRRQIQRPGLFRAAPGLRLGPDRLFDQGEYNSLQCPWHRSPTVAVASFRAAKALRRNPASRETIDGFDWPGAARFDWHSRQLLDLGLIEPGQWF